MGGRSMRLGGVPPMGTSRRPCDLVQAGDAIEKPDGVGMAGPVEDVAAEALLDDLARVHDVDALGVAGDHAQVVRHEHQRPTASVDGRQHELEQLGLGGAIQRRGGLVGDDHLGLAGHAYGDHHPLPHAAAELVRIVVQPARGARDAHHVEQLHGPARALPSCSCPGAARATRSAGGRWSARG